MKGSKISWIVFPLISVTIIASLLSIEGYADELRWFIIGSTSTLTVLYGLIQIQIVIIKKKAKK